MVADPKDITPAEADYDLSGLDSSDDYDLSGVDTKPELTLGRLGGAFYESIKEFPANVARTVRSFGEVSSPYPVAAEEDELYSKKDVFMDSFARYGVQDKIRMQNRQNELIGEGMPKNEAFRKALLENRAEGIQQYNEMQARREAQFEEGTEFLGQVEQQFKKSKEYEKSSGFVEDVAGGIGTSIPSLVGYAAGGPILSSALMYSQIHGSKIKELEDLGVTDADVKLKSAIFSAATQTPLETVSNLFMLSKIMKGNGTWTGWLVNTLEGAVGEGVTEFVQQYPDSYATIMALNPDVSHSDLVKWVGYNLGDLTKDALYAGAIGAISGGIMSGAGGAAKIQIDKYVHPEQKVKNEERNSRATVLVNKVEQGTATPEQEAELASMLGAGPDADVKKIVKDVKKNLVLNKPIRTPERDAAHEAMTSKLGADVADIEIGVFDAMARSWADRTGNKPDAFYTDVVGLRLAEDSDGNQVLYQVDVWHGSPHKFDKVSHDKIGTGEGAQAFGWGTYYTDKKEIASHYAGERFMTTSGNFLPPALDDAETYVLKMSMTDKEKALKSAQSNIDNLNFLFKKNKTAPDRMKYLKKSERWQNIEKAINEGVTETDNVYRAQLFPGKEPSEYTFLDWYEVPPDAIRTKILKAVEESGVEGEAIDISGKYTTLDKFKEHINGESTLDSFGEIYDSLAQLLGDEKAASMFLKKHGIDGIRYPTETLSGKGPKGGDAFNYVVFDEKDVKLVSRESGGKVDTLFQSGKANVWYSQMGNVLAQKLPGRADAPQMAQTIEAFAKKGEFKAEELEWSGVKEWLNGKSGKVTKQEVVDYLAENNVKVEEVVKSEGSHPINKVGVRRVDGEHHTPSWEVFNTEDDKVFGVYSNVADARAARERAAEKFSQPTIFGQYQLPGGENYRELLLTMPEKENLVVKRKLEIRKRMDEIQDEFDIADKQPESPSLVDKRKQLYLEGEQLKKEQRGLDARSSENPNFASSHYQEKNILAHIRFNERVDADGKRVLFIEEIQSDWAQKGRKEGFKNTGELEKVKSRLKELKEIDANKWTKELESEETKLIGERDKLESMNIPDAPFVKDTGKWSMLAMKRMVRWAAENGFDRVAWTTGEQQAARYDLSKQVDEITVLSTKYPDGTRNYRVIADRGGEKILDRGGLKANELSDNIGKELAQKAIDKIETGSRASFKGPDLKVGGEGMKGYYDKILPAEVNKFFNKGAWGNARVGQTTIKIQPINDQTGIQPLITQLGPKRWRVRQGENTWQFETERDAKFHAQRLMDERPQTDSVHSLDITPQMKAKAVSEGMPLFQEQEAAPPQGAIEDLFGDGPALIKLFAGADASTPIHEIGHLGLKLLHQSGDTDYNVLAEYAGVDFERSKMGPGEWTRAEHEKVAKAFEVYIMEGKSPTTRLQMAFAKLKGWLLDIYKTVKAHGVELNDDVRSVFDRLLTTQYERDAAPYFEVEEWVNVADLVGGATNQQEAEILKTEFARRSMDAAEFAGMEYDEMVGKARELALAKVAKKRQTQDKKVKAQFKKEAVKSIETEPFFTMLDEIMKAGGLKYDNVLGLYSSEWIGELNRQRPGVVAHAGRAYSDDIATQYGYESADDMLQDILNKPGKQEAIDSYYNDLVREYESTLHHQDADLYAQVLEQEADILRRMLGKPAVDKQIKGTIRKQTGQITTPEMKELTAQFKRDEQVARNAWNKARKQTRDEERAAATEKRGEAVGKEKARQLEKIMKIKLKQYAAMQTLRDDYKAKREIKEITDRVNRVVRMDSIPYADKVQLTNFVSEYIPLPPTVRGNTPEMSLDEFLAMRHEGNEYIVDAIKIALTHKPQQRLNKAGYRVPLSLDEWRVVGDIVTMIHKMSVMEKKLIGAHEKANIDNLVLDMAKEAYGVWGTPDAPLEPIEQLEALRDKVGWFHSLSDATKNYMAWVVKPQFVFDGLGGYKTDMLNTKNYFPWMMIENASDGELKQGKTVMKEMEDIFKWIKKPSQWSNQKHTVTGFPTPITKEHMIMIALNSGNDGNLKALREGLGLTDEQIENVNKALTPEETQMVEQIWKFVDQFYPQLNQLNIDLTGVPLKKVEGRYFPLVPNFALHEKAQMLAAKAADVNMRAHAYSTPKVDWGSRHERTGMVMAPELSLSVLSNHVSQVLHDINFQIPVRNVKKIINHPDYRSMVKSTVGEASYNQLTPWLVHVGNPRGEPVVEVNKMVRRLRENSTIVGMGFRVIQVLDQMIGFTNTVPSVGIPNMMKAMYHFGTKPIETSNFIKENSPMMASFESSWDRDMQESFSKFSPKTFGKPNWLREAFFVFSRIPDRICKNVAWMSAYFKGIELYSNDHVKAVQHANEILVSTQGSGLPKDLSTWQRGGPNRSEWVKLATMFQTFFSVLINQVMRVASRYRLGNVGLVKTIEAYAFLIAIPSLFSFIMRKRGLPEGDEWIKAPVSFLAAGLPIVRDIVSPWASGFRYQATPAAAGLETASRLLKTVGEMKDDKWQGRSLKELFKLSGFVFGLPTGQALTTADGIMDLANGKTTDPTAIFWRKDRPKKVVPKL